MKYRRLPGTELEISVVGFGCWPLGGEYWGPTDEEAHLAAVRTALEVGINWFDTAPLYGKGDADEVLKRALGEDLDRVLLFTKVGVRLDGEGPGGNDGHAHSDLRPEHVVADCEASLQRLRRPLDVLQVHWPCEWGTALEDTVAALDDLVDRGWIRHWGVCNYPGADVRRMAGTGLVSMQNAYSLMRREVEADQLPTARELGLGFLAYEGLCRGLLTGKYRTPPRFGADDMRSRDDRFRGRGFQYGAGLGRDLARVGEKVGVSGSAVALGWLLARPGVTAVIAGCRTPEQVRANVGAARVMGAAKLLSVVDQVVAQRGPPAW